MNFVNKKFALANKEDESPCPANRSDYVRISDRKVRRIISPTEPLARRIRAVRKSPLSLLGVVTANGLDPAVTVREIWRDRERLLVGRVLQDIERGQPLDDPPVARARVADLNGVHALRERLHLRPRHANQALEESANLPEKCRRDIGHERPRDGNEQRHLERK